ncbi:MAG: GNAT family protein [Burkholderiaceae bacterium]
MERRCSAYRRRRLCELGRDISPSLDGLPEGGWVFSTEVHGRGIATEAVNAALAWMDEHFGAKTTACIIRPENAASIRVAHRAGYREHCRSEFRGSQMIQFRRNGARGASGDADQVAEAYDRSTS